MMVTVATTTNNNFFTVAPGESADSNVVPRSRREEQVPVNVGQLEKPKVENKVMKVGDDSGAQEARVDMEQSGFSKNVCDSDPDNVAAVAMECEQSSDEEFTVTNPGNR